MVSIGAAKCNRNCSTSTHFVLFSRYVTRAARVLNPDYQFRRLSFDTRPSSSPILLHLISCTFSLAFSYFLCLSPSRENMHASVSLLPLRVARATKRAVFETFLKYPSLFHAFESSRMRILLGSCGYHHLVPPFPAPLHPLSSPLNLSLSFFFSLSLPFQTLDRGEKEETRSRQGKRTDKRWINSSNHANPGIPVINRAHENARKRDSRHPCPFVLSLKLAVRFTISRLTLSYRVYQNCCHF